MKKIILAAALCLAVTATASNRKAPQWENYQGLQEASKFLQDALKHIKTNPNDRAIPRLVMELHALGQSLQNQKIIDLTQTFIIGQHSDSIYFPVILKSFKDPQAFQTKCLNLLDINKPINKNYAESMLRFYLRGAKFYPEKEYKKFNDTTALFYLLARKAQHVQLTKQFTELLKRQGDQFAFLKAKHFIAMLEELDDQDRLLKESPIRNFILRLCSIEEKKAPVVSKITLLQELQKKEFAPALKIMNELDPQKTKFAFWRFISNLALKNIPDSKAALKFLTSEQKPISSQCKTLMEQSPYDQATADKVSKVLIQAFQQLRRGNFIRGTVDFTQKHKKIEFSLNTDTKVFQLSLSENGKTLFAYQSSPDGSKVYFDGNEKITEFIEPGLLPVIRSGLNKDTNGKFQFSFAASIGKYEDMERAVTSLWQSPYLSTEKGLSELIAYNINRGVYPIQNERKISFLIPSTDKKIESLHLTFDNNSNLEFIKASTKDYAISLSPKKSGAPTITWPQKPTIRPQKVTMLHFSAAMSSFADLFSPL
ncbi:MAG: hypothetical protein HRT88_18440 [Lentisphaeraceae bacterium]|nr:hypothetical protein [Lentisphaeraceae bacterium]